MPAVLLDLLAPPACAACGRPPPRGDRLCRACRRALRFLGERRCPRCGLPAPCGRRCPAARHAYAAAWAPVAYAGPAVALVRALKERGAVGVAGVMAAQMVAGAPEALLGGGSPPGGDVAAAATGAPARGGAVAAVPPGAPVLVPVPADPLRRRRRGVDHAALLAAAVARRTGLERRAVLVRRPGPRHAGADRAQRRAAAGAVGVRGAPPPLALLVDDVHTTGATFDACARALRAAGCAEIRALAYARTLP